LSNVGLRKEGRSTELPRHGLGSAPNPGVGSRGMRTRGWIQSWNLNERPTPDSEHLSTRVRWSSPCWPYARGLML